MEQAWIYEKTTELHTPVGCFTVESEDGAVAFNVEKSIYATPYEVEDEKGAIIDLLTTETNYMICIPTANLTIGKTYSIRFSSGEWAYCDSDEDTHCYTAVIDRWAVGIGGYDPNEKTMYSQDISYSREVGFWAHKDVYDESEFVEYFLDYPDDCNGFRFRMIDRTGEYVRFYVAWIELGQYPTDEYEFALGLWLT